MESKCKLCFPFDIGDIVLVNSGTLPTGQIDVPEDEVPPFYYARVVSVKKNCNGFSFKVAIRAPWFKHMYFQETGWEDAGVDREKNFTYPLSSIGKTVFVKC